MHVARLQGRDVQPLERLGLFHDGGNVGRLDQQRALLVRARGRRRLRQRAGCRDDRVAAEARIELGQRTQGRTRERLVRQRAERQDLRAHCVDRAVVGEAGERGHAFDPDVGLGTVERLHDALGRGGIADLSERPHDGRRGLGIRREHFDQPRHGLLAAHVPECVDGPLADPPVLVLCRLHQVRNRALVLGLVQDLDRRAAHLVVLVGNELERRADDLRSADLSERVRGAAAHPPVRVANRPKQVLDRAVVADDVQHLDGGATRVLRLVLQYFHEMADGVGMLAAAQELDGRILDVEFRIAQKRRDQRRVDLAAAVRNGAQGRRPDQLVGIFQGPLQRGPHLGRVEARQQRNDVRSCDGVLAVDPGDQFVDARGVHQLASDAEEGSLLVGILQVGGVQELAQVEAVLLGRDDVENRRLRNAGRLQQLEQQRWRIVAGGGERPGDASDRARVFLRERLGEHREGLVVDERRQCLDECDRLALVRGRERVHDRLDRVLAEALEPGQCRLRLRAGRVATLPYLGDEAIRPVASENSHPTPAVLVEPRKNAEQSVCHSTPAARPGRRLRIQCRPPTGTNTWAPARRIG